MAVLRLSICVGGVYVMFLLWAIAQERLSVPFSNLDGTKSDRFRSALIMSTCQSVLSSFSALIYILLRRKPADSLWVALGLELDHVRGPVSGDVPKSTMANGLANGHGHIKHHSSASPSQEKITSMQRDLLVRYFQCAVFITVAAPFGFAALSYISYPTMVLGKSCKLVPVMLMNVLLYRRRFAPHKYLVVAMVTTGITMFMGFGNEDGHSKGKSTPPPSSSSSIGILYLLINLAIDGATNSTQDEIFDKYKVTGQQMMFWINVMSTLVTTLLSVLPLPYIPVLHPSHDGRSELAGALAFFRDHPGVTKPLAQFAFTGSLGQLFIFETLQHFGSLTLVTITLTRKLFTMVLSIIVYKHKLTAGQWIGAGVVFAGISVEAWVKRKDVHTKRVMQEKEKAEIKSL